MTLKEISPCIHLDYIGAVARFGGMESLVVKFLKKFPEDPIFGELAKAVENKDYKEIERTAHALKGMTGNLGLSDLFEINQKIVNEVRIGHYEQIPEYFQKDQEIYDNVIQYLKKLD